MVSGSLLLSGKKSVSVGELYKQRIPKQAIPFIIWSIIYVVVRIVMGKIPLNAESFTSLLYEPAYYQFWFMYTLLAIYLLLPLLQTLIKHCDKQKIEYILVLWFVFSIAVPLVSRWVPGFRISEHVGLVLCEGYIGYFILGHYLKKYKSNIKPSVGALMWLCGAIGTGIFAVVEFLCSKEVYSGFVYQAYLTPFVVLSSCGVFILFGNSKINVKEKTAGVISGLSVLSIGVYYIHMLVLTALEKIGILGNTNILILIVKILATYILSLIGAFIISKIPFIRKILLGVN
jgi:surface polysaccharide O-acyltransferase-like enzyme